MVQNIDAIQDDGDVHLEMRIMCVVNMAYGHILN